MKSAIAALVIMTAWLVGAPHAIELRIHHEEKEGVFSETDSIAEDYLFIGHELHFSGQAQDVIFLGERLSFDGTADLGLFALAEKLVFAGKTGNGVMAAGMDITVDGAVSGASFIGCKSLHIGDGSIVSGSLFAGCAKLVVDGVIEDDLYAGAGEIVINNAVRGNVHAHGGRIIIGENGAIQGDLTYSAKEKLSEEELARVAGTTRIARETPFGKRGVFPEKLGWMIRLLVGLAFFVSFAIVGVVLLFLPAFRRLDTRQSPRGFWTTALWGLIPALMYPGVIVLSFVLVVTIPFGIVLLLAAAPLLYGAWLIGATLLGKYLCTALHWNIHKRHYQFLIGLVAAGLIGAIPYVNFLGFLLFAALGWGVYLSFLFDKRDFLGWEQHGSHR